MKAWAKQSGFTIVELLIVIVVIAILAAITIVAFNGIRQQAERSALDSAIAQAYRLVETERLKNNDQYPASLASIGVTNDDVTYDYQTYPYGFCVSGTNDAGTYHVSTDNPSPTFGGCGQVKAEYFNNTSFSGQPVATTYIAHMTNNWGTGSPLAGTVNADSFTSRFTSYIVPPVTGSYTFYTMTDDVDRLVIDNVTLINNLDGSVGGCCALRTYSPINLTAGQAVPVLFEQREGGGGAYAQLYWTHPSQTTRVGVPTSAFVRVP